MKKSRVSEHANADVIIIGAGASGLSASQRLHAAGISSIVLEARQHIGGRIAAKNYPWGRNTIPIQTGAEFIHWNEDAAHMWQPMISDNGFQVDHVGVNGQTFVKGELQHDMNDRPPKSSAMLLELEKRITQHFRAGGADMSIADFVRAYPLSSAPDAEHMKLLHATLANEWGEDLEQLSLQTMLEPDSYTAPNYRLREGFFSMVKTLNNQHNLRVGTAVQSVRWEIGRVLVQTEANSILTAEHCITTVPIGMLRRGKPRYEPTLPPEKTSAFEQILPGRVTKVIMRFRERFWSPDMNFLRGGRQQLSWPPLSHHDRNAPYLSALVGGDDADRLAHMGSGEAAREVATEIMSMHSIKNPKGLFVNGDTVAWHTEPFIKTGYSSIAIGAETNVRERLRQPVENTLFFAGEATSAMHPGSVHGAMESGIRAAEEIIALRTGHHTT